MVVNKAGQCFGNCRDESPQILPVICMHNVKLIFQMNRHRRKVLISTTFSSVLDQLLLRSHCFCPTASLTRDEYHRMGPPPKI